jgi:hypothetical protein
LKWKELISALRELIQDLRAVLLPDGRPRDWGQVALCQRVITTLELIGNTSEFARRWTGDPTTPLDRLTIEIGELQEGWVPPHVERIRSITEKMTEQWRVVQ